MTETSTELETQEHFRELAHHPEELPMLPGELRPHPKPAQYVFIAVILVIVTAIEVGMYYLEEEVNSNLLIAILLALGAIKFVIVASWYMHLRTDVKFFSRVFTVGCLAAGVLYAVALASLAVFD